MVVEVAVEMASVAPLTPEELLSAWELSANRNRPHSSFIRHVWHSHRSQDSPRPQGTMDRQYHCLPEGHGTKGGQKGHFRQRNNTGENILIRASTEVEITHMSTNWWVDKQTVVYPCSQILPVERNEVVIPATTWWTLKTCSVAENTCKMFHIVWLGLDKMSRIGKSIQTESRL